MKPGTVIFSDKFEFRDGTSKEKFAIVLNDDAAGYYLVLRTTSNPDEKGYSPGCQVNNKRPNFYIPRGISGTA